MMMTKNSGRWLGLLAVAVLLSPTAAYTWDDDDDECYSGNYADGDCDESNNRAECGYDGGDCCSCTCVSTDNYTCGVRGYACIDPEAACVDDDDITIEMFEECGWVDGIGNGYCDSENNKAICGYDGGDCCECTCVGNGNYDDDYMCSADGSGFACIDPSAPCVDDDDVTVEMVENCDYIQGIGNGYCDQGNNNAICDYDGGDCCACTCDPGDNADDDYVCSAGGSGFACIDPSAPCVDDDDVTVEMVENCQNVQGLGDGHCEAGNNNEVCGYDGGDCCECTCVVPENSYDWDDDYRCSAGGSGFLCIDPAAPCVDDDDITVDLIENCKGYFLSIGNGYCDERNNNEECGYDGGDCCECTCVAPERTDDWTGDDYQGCGNGFACIDPSAPCVDDDDITTGLLDACDEVSMGNAYCNQQNNKPECNYDGGDCCSCTCEDTPNQQCGQYGGFACIDPEAACVDDDDITVDMLDKCGYVGDIGDGYCNEENNIAECNYDGGDCCECTCVAPENSYDWDDDYRCSASGSGFACVDPSAECVDDDSVTVDMLGVCDTRDIGNGRCDDRNNREECAWDGGDCCSCTCDPGDDADDDRWLCREFACIDPSAACVEDDDITIDMLENCGYAGSIGNGYCDQDNNKAECNYDGGDCCECTCEVTEYYSSDSRWSGCNEFACIDPEAPCVDEDLITVDMIEKCDYVLGIGNGYCDRDMNNEDCAYDGGDCCSCTCEYDWDDDYACSADGSGFDCKDPLASCIGEAPTMDDDDYSDDDWMSYEFVDFEQDGPLPTVDGAVEVGTKTEVGVTATAYDVRAGNHDNDVGCGEVGGDGCAPQNTRDGISSEIESRWSCAPKLVEDDGPCQIEYTFADPQDIVAMEVAFWKGNERIRKLKVHIDGVESHTHESFYEGSIFNRVVVAATGVSTVTLESVELLSDEWISLIEVLIFVTP